MGILSVILYPYASYMWSLEMVAIPFVVYLFDAASDALIVDFSISTF